VLLRTVALVSGILVTSCASDLKSPHPNDALNVAPDVQRFGATAPEQVLAAVEDVLREHRPEGTFTHNANFIEMRSKRSDFAVLAIGEESEAWTVTARAEGNDTVASATMWVKGWSAVALFGSSSYEYPQRPNWARPDVRIDYGTFWQRVRNRLADRPTTGCTKPAMENGFRFYEPLCRHYTVRPVER